MVKRSKKHSKKGGNDNTLVGDNTPIDDVTVEAGADDTGMGADVKDMGADVKDMDADVKDMGADVKDMGTDDTGMDADTDAVSDMIESKPATFRDRMTSAFSDVRKRLGFGGKRYTKKKRSTHKKKKSTTHHKKTKRYTHKKRRHTVRNRN